MTLTPDDANREIYERRRRLGFLRARAARDGAESSPQLILEIQELEAQLAGTESPDLDFGAMSQPSSVSRYEFNALVVQVNRITLVLFIATVALVLALAAFIMALLALVGR